MPADENAAGRGTARELPQGRRAEREAQPRRSSARKDAAPSGVDDREALAGVLGQLAHDLRTPLGSLSLWLHGLRADCEQAAVAAHSLAKVESATRGLIRLAEDLDDAAQVVRGSLRIHAQPVELRALLEGIRQRLVPQAEVKEVELRMAFASQSIHVAGDRDRLDRTLDALVSGALAEASPGMTVVTALEPQGDQVVISISPSPVGPDGLPHLHDQLAPRAGRGSPGLPLALARYVLDAHHASVEVGTSELRLRLQRAVVA